MIHITLIRAGVCLKREGKIEKREHVSLKREYIIDKRVHIIEKRAHVIEKWVGVSLFRLLISLFCQSISLIRVLKCYEKPSKAFKRLMKPPKDSLNHPHIWIESQSANNRVFNSELI